MPPRIAAVSTALQFFAVVGVAFLLILTLFTATFGIRGLITKKNKKRTPRDTERGAPIPPEVAPLLAEFSQPKNYQYSYGATSVQPTPADRRGVTPQPMQEVEQIETHLKAEDEDAGRDLTKKSAPGEPSASSSQAESRRNSQTSRTGRSSSPRSSPSQIVHPHEHELNSSGDGDENSGEVEKGKAGEGRPNSSSSSSLDSD